MRSITSIFFILFCIFSATSSIGKEPKGNELHPIAESSYSWRLIQNEVLTELEVIHNKTNIILSNFDLSDCSFCSGEEDNCEFDGIFAYTHQHIKEPLIVVACHVGAHSQRFELFRPFKNKTKPVFSIIGNYYVDYLISSQKITVRYDRNEQEKTIVWPK